MQTSALSRGVFLGVRCALFLMCGLLVCIQKTIKGPCLKPNAPPKQINFNLSNCIYEEKKVSFSRNCQSNLSKTIKMNPDECLSVCKWRRLWTAECCAHLLPYFSEVGLCDAGWMAAIFTSVSLNTLRTRYSGGTFFLIFRE